MCAKTKMFFLDARLINIVSFTSIRPFVQSAGGSAVEYTDCLSAEG